MLTVNFSPFPLLETARLQLRCISEKDAAEMFFLKSNKEVLKYLDRDAFVSKTEALTFIKLILSKLQNNESVSWAITYKDSGKMIGTIEYWRFIKEHFRAEVGYMLHPDEWGKGIMKEALGKVIQYAFKEIGLHSIEANINPGNAASAALLESKGFVKEAYFRENYYHSGNFTDSVIYSLVNF